MAAPFAALFLGALEWDQPQTQWMEDPELFAAASARGCDVTVIDDADTLSPGEFAARFRHHKPVLLRGMSAVAALRRRLATKAGVIARLSRLPDMPLIAEHVGAGLHGISNLGIDRRYRPLDEFIAGFSGRGASFFEFSRDLPPDIFGAAPSEWPPRPLAHAFPPDDAEAPPYRGLGISASGYGLPVHAHAEVYNVQVHGAKLWVLWGPGELERVDKETVYSRLWPENVQVSEYFRSLDDLPAAQRPLQCVAQPGDVLYLPDFWWHGTMSIGDSVCVGAQNRRAVTNDALQRVSSCHGVLGDGGPSGAEPEGSTEEVLELYANASALAPWCPWLTYRWAKTAYLDAASAAGVRGALRVYRDHMARLAALNATGLISLAQAGKELRIMGWQLLAILRQKKSTVGRSEATLTRLRRTLFKLSRRFLKKTLEYTPSDPYVLGGLADLASMEGDPTGAKALAEKGLQMVTERLRLLPRETIADSRAYQKTYQKLRTLAKDMEKLVLQKQTRQEALLQRMRKSRSSSSSRDGEL